MSRVPDSVRVYFAPERSPKRTGDPWVVTAMYGRVVETTRYPSRGRADDAAGELAGARD